MRISVTQTRAVRGDILGNIERHKAMIDLAISNRAEIVIFPELSLTGYEPNLAKDLATDLDDNRLDDFQQISDSRNITIGVGLPTRSGARVCISMIIFQKHQPRQMYSKKYLHPDEEAFFVSGSSTTEYLGHKNKVGLAICYELLVPEHAENVHRHEAELGRTQ